jgi:hypothetical protein
MRWLNEMAANTHAKDVPFADHANRQAELGDRAGPVEARPPVALPVLAEAAGVVGVVGAEVEEDGTRVTDGQPGAKPRREGEQKGRRGARPDGHEAYFTRTAA